MAVPYSMRYTLSTASPDKAAQIRSAVTGALKKDSSGLLCFETTVETTFLLPWDLNPKVEPEKLSVSVRDQIRTDLLDQEMLEHLEGCGSINSFNKVTWQCRALNNRSGSDQQEWVDAGQLQQWLEAGYHSLHHQANFVLDLVTYQVDYRQQQLLNTCNQELFETRRLALSPLMPMRTEPGPCSLFHACSLAFWGVHDRTSLLKDAVDYCLADPKAQFLLYDRWSQQLDTNSAKKEFPQWEAAKKECSPCLYLFALANIVQRPIIVYAHSDCNISGVYLPLLWKDSCGQYVCHAHPHLRNPIALGYSTVTCHYTPLVTFKGQRGPHPLLLPLMTSSGKRLPVHFLLPAERSSDPDATQILSELMFIDLIPPTATPITPLSPSSSSSSLPSQMLVAVSYAAELPEVMDSLIKQYQSRFL